MSRARPSAVVPGNHDGVHEGHRALLAEARRAADRLSLDVVALTFDPHPLVALAPERAPTPLTTIGRRIELLRKAGADDVVVARFDGAYASQPPEDFVREVLGEQLRARAIVLGPDFRFGVGRSGTPELLRALGQRDGFEVHEVGPVTLEGLGRISSTGIREALRDGDIARATTMLGRLHEIEGTVVTGHRRGRTIGFPTANLDVDPILLPTDGVYAIVARAVADDRTTGPLLRGVANLGTRPTFAAGRSVEAHLFDFDGDLYRQRLRVGFVERLRDERKFDGIDALRAQIERDAAAARARLEAPSPLWDAL